MARTYVVQDGDTLGKIANKFYSEAALFKKLADYNGIRNPDLIAVGQRIEIPSRRELEGTAPPAPAAQNLAPPSGLEGIIATFGNLYDYLRDDGTLDPKWETEKLGRAPIPFPIRISWEPSKFATGIQCHRKLADVIPAVFEAIQSKGLEDKVKTFGGCFNFRSKRTSGKLSTHSWGIAIDLNPETNVQGKAGDIDPRIVEVFQSFGFKWGGDWPGKAKDPMHFQFCTGY